ncbi:MAG: hypothetical protein KBS52_07255 [Clostridiales bacterium]|nr:hypothetical protein [Candidatus Equinaster intestinalis]
MKLASIFSNGAVFQRNQKILVFGEGDGEFSAEFLGEERKINANGKFCVEFSAHEAGGPYKMQVNLNGEKKTIENIMIGEVILISGQSNAELTIAETFDSGAPFKSNPNVRFYLQTRPHQDESGAMYPERCIFNENWSELRENEAKGWSAIALHTALYFEKKLGVAVGVVGAYKGSTIIQSFLSDESYKKFDIDYDKCRPFPQTLCWNKPSYMYNYVVEKLVPYQFGSAVWYQGESNATVYEGSFYDGMLKELITDYRARFKNANLPFAVVQINRFRSLDESGTVAIQEAQKRVAENTENVKLVTISDLGEHTRIHPRNKKQVSERICAVLEELNEGLK